MAKPKTTRANPALRLAFIRQWHVYISVFVAPSLLFFALTGALQTFRIPDLKTAPVVMQKLARLHKDDVFAVDPPRIAQPEVVAPEAVKPPEAKAEEPRPARSTTVMKWFFAAVALAVATTTLLGLWMALAYSRRKALMWAILIAGAAAPVLILML
ncbi:hypothetical protein [Phenylobacterium sp.]|uniref:hypothetical protein n=1 Tax=Phenylobacterium sp. TaxID=1871053 RepID=UPI00286A4618|nr:hypothetical protein [Phenylobacterium sp.]